MENRMNFQTSVELPAGMPSVSHADHILLMGSCFAENIGRQLMDAGFQLDLNPFGILYNPLSVSSALREIIRNKNTTNKICLPTKIYGIARCIMALFLLLRPKRHCIP